MVCCDRMFGMGGSGIIVILIVALLFLGPDKLPGAAKTISKGIRDIKKQSRLLQNQIESDEQIGGAIRDLKSALRGDEIPVRRPPIPKKKEIEPPVDTANTIHDPAKEAPADGAIEATFEQPSLPAPEERVIPKVTLPDTAGEADGPAASAEDDAELAALVKPAPGTVAKGS